VLLLKGLSGTGWYTGIYKANHPWCIFAYISVHLKSTNMKVIAGILIVLGIVMILFRGFNVQTEKKVVDIGPVQINKKQNNWIGWPTYAGLVAIGAGVVMLVVNKKQ
jgi:phosphatidylserine synthase